MRYIQIKAIILTSIIWCMLYIFLLMYYTQCTITKLVFLDKKNVIEENKNRNELSGSTKRSNYELLMKAPGQNGTGVIMSADELDAMMNIFHKHEFNLIASEKISLQRSLPDIRSRECKMKGYIYPDVQSLPTTSVVIIFHNEAWSTLMRTVFSVINRTPHMLLEEIILVDDFSDLDHLKQRLDNYVIILPVKVKVLRLNSRRGLIEARVRGADIAKGETVTFLDSHCECTEGWIEPLLYEIYKNSKAVVSPLVDTIDNYSFEYKPTHSLLVGVFKWSLNFGWDKLSQREVNRRKGDPTQPIRTPAIVGCIITVNRKYFYEIGAFDTGMRIYGAENIEISLKTWMCHGSLLIVPCSRVGHLFKQQFQYTFPGKGFHHTLDQNNARLAEVWMDEWKSFFYNANPSANGIDFGNITDRLDVKQNMKCKSFKWYLENIYPEMIMPLKYHYLGPIISKQNGYCLTHYIPSLHIHIEKCRETGEAGGEQAFCFTSDGLLMSNSKCVEYDMHNHSLSFQKCDNTNVDQKWIYNQKVTNVQIIHKKTHMCLDVPIKSTDSGTMTIHEPVLSSCDETKISQQWILLYTNFQSSISV